MFRCHFCSMNCGDEEQEYTKHMFRFHKDRPDFSMICGHDGCQISFKSYKSRMVHVNRCHSVKELPNSVNVVDVGPLDANVREEGSGVNETSTDNGDLGDNEHVGAGIINPEFAQAQFLLSLRAKNLSSAIMDSVIENADVLVRSTVEHLSSKILDHLKNGNGKLDGNTLSQLVQGSTECFSGMKSKWLQNKYFKLNMGMIEPKKMVLEAAVQRNIHPTGCINRKVNITHDSYHYVSLLDTLKCLYSNEHFTSLLQPIPSSCDNVLQGWFDGLCVKSNPILKANPDAIAIVLYYDELNLVDTASSRPVKMGMFYFSILNMKEEHRSSLLAIYLLMAVDSLLINTYGINEFLDPIVADLKILQNGLELPNGKVLFGTLLACMGDNLALNEMGGFKMGFTAFKCCRYCNASDIQIFSRVVNVPEDVIRSRWFKALPKLVQHFKLTNINDASSDKVSAMVILEICQEMGPKKKNKSNDGIFRIYGINTLTKEAIPEVGAAPCMVAFGDPTEEALNVVVYIDKFLYLPVNDAVIMLVATYYVFQTSWPRVDKIPLLHIASIIIPEKMRSEITHKKTVLSALEAMDISV